MLVKLPENVPMIELVKAMASIGLVADSAGGFNPVQFVRISDKYTESVEIVKERKSV